jgi:hypothetical protein
MDCSTVVRDSCARTLGFVGCLGVFLFLAIAAAGQTAPPVASTPPDQKCTLEGKVTNSQTSELVKKATLHLHPSTRDGNLGLVSVTAGFIATSQSDGTFHFEGLEPGEYRLSGERAGFINTRYGAKGNAGTGTTLALQPGQHLTGINMALIPQGVITGKVLDDDGDPMGQASVHLLSRNWIRGKERYLPAGQTGANELGEFRISNLSPGKYYLVASKDSNMIMGGEEAATPGKPDIRPVRTFYPSALDRQGASLIHVKAGQELSGMDIRMRASPTYHISGKITGSFPEGGVTNMRLSLAQEDEDDMMGFSFGPSSNIAKDGTFNLPGVAPGSYVLTVVSMGGKFRILARQPVGVENAAVKDVVVSLMPPATIKGQMRVEGTRPASVAAPDLQSIQVYLQPADTFMIGGNATPKADGSFVLEDVSRGKYSFSTSRSPEGTYLKSLRFGNQDVLGKELDLTSGAGGELELSFSYGVSTVSGTLQLPEPDPSAAPSDATAQKPASPPSAELVLVPEALRPDGSGLLYANPDQSGAFTFKSVPPGHYRAYAFENVSVIALSNPLVLEAFQSKGTEVEVKENDKKDIQLKMIPSDDFQQVLTKLGIDQ